MPAELSDDPYAILGVPRNASAADVKEAYRRLAKATHPDIDARPEAMGAMVRINHAYELLADPLRRSRWDALNPVDRKPSRRGPAAAPRPGATPPRGASGSNGSRTGPAAGGRDRSAHPTERPGTRSTSSQTPGPGPAEPTLDEAFAFRFGTGKYQRRTIGEVVAWDRGYVEWVARTSRDRPRLAAAARRVLMHLDEVEREATRAATPGMGTTQGPPPDPGPTRWLTRERAVVALAATLAAIATFLVAWLLLLVLGS